MHVRKVISTCCDVCKRMDKLIPGSKELDTVYELFLKAANRQDTNSVIYVHYTCIRLAMRKADAA